MFTGIIQQLGQVVEMAPAPAGARLLVDSGGWRHRPAFGESISVNGCCLTLAAGEGSQLAFDVVSATLEATTLGTLTSGASVNLEHAVTPSSLLGGHVVQGHVEGVARIIALAAEDPDWRLRVEPPAELFDAIIERGSVALDGVSLTIARVEMPWFEVALIPTTRSMTTLGAVRVGTMLNLETDYIARTVVTWLRRNAGAPREPEGGITGS